MIPFIVSGENIIAHIRGKPHQVGPGHPNYEKIKAGLKTLTEDQIMPLIDIPEHLRRSMQDHKVEVKNSCVYIDGKEVRNSMTKRLLEFIKFGFPIDSFVKFIENIYKNPADHAINELHDFLEMNMLPITEDGCFLAYKRITADWKDCYTRSVDNSIGAKPSMDRSKVDPNRNNLCSTGYHACSLSYLGSYSGDRTIIVKINPKDVVSVPPEYKNAKLRCCTYEVITELNNDQVTFAAKKDAKTDSVQENSGPIPDHFVSTGEYQVPEGKKDSRVWLAVYAYAQEKKKKVSDLFASKLSAFNLGRSLCSTFELDQNILKGAAISTLEEMEVFFQNHLT